MRALEAPQLFERRRHDRSLKGEDFAAGEIPKGEPGRSALEPLRSGETITGAWAVSGMVGGASFDQEAVTFPIPAPDPVDSKHVVLTGNDSTAGDGCSGSAAAPVAGAGFVCLYVANSFATTSGGGYGARTNFSGPSDTGDGSRSGFAIRMFGQSGFNAGGTWAYTAP